ncbi:MAG: radical SAM protein [Nanoarchaeota archaeon]|nr:radical SAM protein [Patescibacteria group bacterium]MCG2719995.1 radical SAM protein [Nanoarchaeota archaeon]
MKKILRKSLLYKSDVEYADFCLNHVEGCSHGCKFPCYAMQMAKRYGRIKNYFDWCKPKLVENALELLDKEIPRYKDKIKFVHLCFMTDPFMYDYKEIQDMSLKIIKRLNKDQIRCTVLTKGIYPKKLIDKKTYGVNNEYGITLVSLDDKFKEKFEPYSASYKRRINALKELHKKGLKTWVSIEPYPTPNIVKQELLTILNSISFVDKIVFGKLNYNVIASHYNGNKEFYNSCAKLIKKFCSKKGIQYHIKYGTEREDNIKTVKIFK